MLKAKLAVGASVLAGGLLAVSNAFASTMSSSTLGEHIDSLNGTVVDYFNVLLAKYWPFVVGFAVLVAVWHFGRRIIGAFN